MLGVVDYSQERDGMVKCSGGLVSQTVEENGKRAINKPPRALQYPLVHCTGATEADAQENPIGQDRQAVKPAVEYLPAKQSELYRGDQVVN